MGIFNFRRIKKEPVGGGVLTGEMIDMMVSLGLITISDYDPKNLNPNSYNLRISDKFTVYRGIKAIDMHNPETYSNTETYDIEKTGTMLRPGTLYLIPTHEKIGSNHFEPVITGRSSVGRLGIEVHKEAGFGDIGYVGVWTLHMTVTYPTIIYPNEPVLQVYFLTPYGPITNLYDGKYQHSASAVPSRWGLSDQDA